MCQVSSPVLWQAAMVWRFPIVPEMGDDSEHCGGGIGEVILKVSLTGPATFSSASYP